MLTIDYESESEDGSESESGEDGCEVLGLWGKFWAAI